MRDAGVRTELEYTYTKKFGSQAVCLLAQIRVQYVRSSLGGLYCALSTARARR